MNCWYFYITGSVIKKKSLHPLNTVSFIKHAVVLYMYYSKKILVHDKYSEAKKKLPSSQASSSSSCLLFLNDLSPAWPSSRSICACPCSVITSPILINATTTTRWLSFGLEKCTPPGVRRFHVSPSEREREIVEEGEGFRSETLRPSRCFGIGYKTSEEEAMLSWSD